MAEYDYKENHCYISRQHYNLYLDFGEVCKSGAKSHEDLGWVKTLS